MRIENPFRVFIISNLENTLSYERKTEALLSTINILSAWSKVFLRTFVIVWGEAQIPFFVTVEYSRSDSNDNKAYVVAVVDNDDEDFLVVCFLSKAMHLSLFE